MWHDDEDDTDFESFGGGEDDAESVNAVRELHEAPLRRKAREIARLTHALVQSLESGQPPRPDDDRRIADGTEKLDAEHVRAIGGFMLENGYTLGAKLAGVRHCTDYGRCMEAAVLIKLAAENLLSRTSFCRELRLTRPAYLQTLRNEIEAFRLLFRAWVPTLDRTDHYDDGWGLFEP